MGGKGSGGGLSGRKPSMGSRRQSEKQFVPTGEPGALELPEHAEEVYAAAMVDALEGGAAMFRDILLPDLNKLGVYQATDAPMLVELCEALAMAAAYRQMMQQEIAGGSLTVLTSTEHRRLVSNWQTALKTAMTLASEFGLSPVARMRLGLMQMKAGGLLDALGDDDEDEGAPADPRAIPGELA